MVAHTLTGLAVDSEMERAVSHQAIDDASTATPIKEEIIIAGIFYTLHVLSDACRGGHVVQHSERS